MGEFDLRRLVDGVCSARRLTFVGDVGAGAFKSTFYVETEAGDARALKVYKRAGLNERIVREIEAIRRCTHAGVARFELVGTISLDGEEFVYSLEEFLGGGTLTSKISTGLLSVDEMKQLAVTLSDSIGHIASLGLVHRDLKPDNIMFRDGPSGPEPVIVDFGLVRDLSQSSLTQTWQTQGPGTPYYAPPEQLNNRKQMIDWRSDQFSLAVTLALCCHGQHPYATTGASTQETVELVAAHQGPSQAFVDWTKHYNIAVLLKMASPWPISRFRTPATLLAAWTSSLGTPTT